MKSVVAPIAALLLVMSVASAHAAVLRTAVLGCKLPEDALKASAMKAKKDTSGLDTLTSSRACISFAKGIMIDVDETKGPLSCIRLTGDLQCYWIPDDVIDQFPGEKGSGGGQQGGRRRH